MSKFFLIKMQINLFCISELLVFLQLLALQLSSSNHCFYIIMFLWFFLHILLQFCHWWHSIYMITRFLCLTNVMLQSHSTKAWFETMARPKFLQMCEINLWSCFLWNCCFKYRDWVSWHPQSNQDSVKCLNADQLICYESAIGLQSNGIKLAITSIFLW